MLKLYHGTDIFSAQSIYQQKAFDVNIGYSYVDFGPGFYTTDSYQQATAWAYRKAKLRHAKPALVILDFDATAAQPYIVKFADDLRWGRFIVNNRNGYKYIEKVPFKEHNLNHKYHITFGRIADLKVLSIIQQLRQSEKLLNDIGNILNCNYAMQYVFHTEFSKTFVSRITYKSLVQGDDNYDKSRT